MGATVLFTMISLPVLASVALVMVLVKDRMSLAATEPAYEQADAEVYVSTPATLALN